MTIYSAVLVDFRPGAVAEAEIVVVSGKGAYMRVLAADLGDALGTGGLLGWLVADQLRNACARRRRSRSSSSRRWTNPGWRSSHLTSPWRICRSSTSGRRRCSRSVAASRCGCPARSCRMSAGECRMHDPTGELIGIGELNGGLLRPTKVLAG